MRTSESLNKPFDSRVPKAPAKVKHSATVQELPESNRSASLFKENQRLSRENLRLTEKIKRLETELGGKEEYALALASISQEKPDNRRLALYSAKLRKQERLISLLLAAMESSKHLQFGITRTLETLTSVLSRTSNPEECLASTRHFLQTAKKNLREAEKAGKVAYAQMLNNNKISQNLFIEGDLDWTASIVLDGRMLLRTEELLGKLLNSLIEDWGSAVGLAGEACVALLSLGIRLPSDSPVLKRNVAVVITENLRKEVLASTKPLNKDSVAKILGKIASDIKGLVAEKEVLRMELKDAREQAAGLQDALRELNAKVQGDHTQLKALFEGQICGLFEELWAVWKNRDSGSSPVQLMSVFSLNGPKLRKCLKQVKSIL